MKQILLFLIGATIIISGCSTMTTSEKEQKRSELDAMAAKAIVGLVEQDAKIQAELDQSLGHACRTQ